MRKVINHKRVRTLEETAGVCCLLAGLLAPLLAGLLGVSEWILGAGVPSWIHVAGTVLWVIAIPLIVFAGFCLDWAEQEQRKEAYDPEGAMRNRA